MNSKQFSKKIIDWYNINHRQLPWRDTNDPYKIWLSEIILQQTRVAQGMPYYLNFIRKFPTVKQLAAASEEMVLRNWQGLGYYTRARNLHACAKEIVSNHKGKFPSNYHGLLDLPGIGPYTAAAIASIAFNEPVAVVDGNVYRILARIFGIDTDINSSEGKNLFNLKANELMDVLQPGIFNQAMMELGAILCSPKSPACTHCVFKKNCAAYSRDLIHLLPVKNTHKKITRRYFTYVLLKKGKKLAMKRREQSDIWRGLYDFHLVESRRYESVDKVMKQSGLKKLAGKSKVKLLHRTKHVLTHQVIDASFIQVHTEGSTEVMETNGLKFYTPAQIQVLPKPALITRFLTEKGILE